MKEGLAMRVLRQWMMRTATKCWKAWSTYVMKRKLRRELGAPESGRGAELERPPPRVVGAAAEAQLKVAEAWSAVTNFF